jgi:hypothetical protein
MLLGTFPVASSLVVSPRTTYRVFAGRFVEGSACFGYWIPACAGMTGVETLRNACLESKSPADTRFLAQRAQARRGDPDTLYVPVGLNTSATTVYGGFVPGCGWGVSLGVRGSRTP